jgi:hypothetical protein
MGNHSTSGRVASRVSLGILLLLAMALLGSALAGSPSRTVGASPTVRALEAPSPAQGTALVQKPPSAASSLPAAKAPSAPDVGASVTATKNVDKASALYGDTLNYTVVVSDSGLDATGVAFSDTLDANLSLSGSVQASPVAVDDSYACTGNLSITIAAGSGVLVNDYMGQNPAATVTASDTTSANGGTVSVAADGSFTYEPAAGYTGTDTFTYTLSNTAGSSVGTVRVTVSNRVWFIDNSAGACTSGSCNGRLSHPFTSLAAFTSAAVDGAGDCIFVYKGTGNYSGALTLKTNERLIGQGDALNAATLGFTPAANGPALPGAIANPTLTGTLTLATGATVLAVDLSTGSSNGVVATGATGITVGDGCNVTTTTGTAVSLTNSDGTFTFRSVSANGGANGIVWNNGSAATGSLTVTGDGSTAASGGTIRNMAGADGAVAGTGIYLKNAKGVSLSWMQLNDFQNFAIRGFSVNGFTLNRTVISGTNGTSATENEGCVSFGANTGEPGGPANGLTGSSTISNCTMSGGYEDNLRVTNQSGSLNRLTLTNTTIGPNSSTTGNDGVLIEGESAAALSVTIQGCTLYGARGSLFAFILNGNNTADLVFQGNTLSNPAPYNANAGSNGLSLISGNNVAAGAFTTFNISSNTFRDANGHAVLVVKSTDPGSLSGTLNNNTIGIAGISDSGSAAGDGIKVQNAGLGTVTANATNNHIYQYNNFGIELLTGGGASAMSGALNATMTGNVISNPGTGGLPMNGVHLNGGTVPGDTYQICADIRTNSITGSGANGGTDFRLRQRQATTVRLPGYGGANNDNAAAVTFVSGNNSGASGLASNTVPTGGGFVGGGSCAQPTTIIIPLEGGSAPAGDKVVPLADSQLGPVFSEALFRLASAGLSTEELASLERLSVRAGDLPQGLLAEVTGDEITLDRTASGHGWFVDPTPYDDAEFDLSETGARLVAAPGGPAHRSVDLLSVLMNTLGSAAYHRAVESGAAPDNEAALSAASLLPSLPSGPVEQGVRCLPLPAVPPGGISADPSPAESASAAPAPSAAPSLPTQVTATTLSLSVGTLPAGKSVTIKFAATIANPLNVPATSITNQCSVSGANFSTATSNIATTSLPVPPSVTSQPSDQSVCLGAPANFSASASGSPTPTVQWQVSTDAGVTFNDVPGATSSPYVFTPVLSQSGYKYRAVFTNIAGTDTSGAATLTVNTAPAVTTNPSDQTLCAGSTGSFTAAASGSPAPTVQWQVSTDGGATFSDLPGATSTTLTFGAGAVQNGYQYRAVFTNTCSSATTSAATLTVNAAPTVTTNPLDQALCAGATASFTAAASGTPTPAVRWQVSTDGGANFNDVPGATSTTLSFASAAGQSGYEYHAVFTNSCGTATTTAATLTVSTSPAITTNPSNQTVCAGSTGSFTAAASGTPTPTVQWQVSTDGGAIFGDIPGATSTTLSFGAGAVQDGYQYRAVFTNSCGTATTTAATLTVKTAPAVTGNPADQTVCAGASVSFSASAAGSPSAPIHKKGLVELPGSEAPSPGPPVQWQVSANGGATFNDIPGATSTTLSFTSASGQNGNLYRAVFTNSCGTATTTAATLTVNTAPAATTNPSNQAVCSGSSVSFTAAGSGLPSPTVQWQVSTNGGATFNDIAGATSTTLSFTVALAQDGYQYRAVFTNTCGTATTTTATLTVNTSPGVTTNPSNQTVCAGSSVSFTAASSGTPTPTVQWQVSTNGGATFGDVPGATSATLTFTAAAGQSGNQYRAVFTTSCGTATTTAATLTVNSAPSVTTDPSNQTLCAGSTVSFTAAAIGVPSPTVQWQVSTNGGATFGDVSGATSTTLSFIAAAGQSGNQYRAVFTNTCGNATTTAATLTVHVAPTITANPSPQTAYAGSGVSFSASASGTPTPTVQWQASADGGATFNNIPGATSVPLTFTASLGQNGNQYRAVFTDSCGSAATLAATLTVWPQVIATAATPGPTTGLTPLTVAFTGAGSGGDGGPYTFDWNFGDGSPHSGAQNPSHTYNIGGSFTITLTVTDGHGVFGTDSHLVVTPTATSVPVVYNIYDDQGRSRLCVNRLTGAYVWSVPAVSPTTTYTGMAQVLNGGTKIVNLPGASVILNVTIDPLKKKGTGYLISGSAYVSVLDSNITNNPPGCY